MTVDDLTLSRARANAEAAFTQVAERSLATDDRRQTAAWWRELAQTYEQTLAWWPPEKPGHGRLQALRDCARELGAGDV